MFARVNARVLAMAGGEPGMMLHNAYGYGLFTGGLGLHYGGERLGMTVVPVSGGMTERQLGLIDDFRPDMITCTPSYALTLAQGFAERGVKPDEISLRFACVGAEPWTESMRAEIDAGLGIRATNIYGLSEIIGPGSPTSASRPVLAPTSTRTTSSQKSSTRRVASRSPTAAGCPRHHHAHEAGPAAAPLLDGRYHHLDWEGAAAVGRSCAWR